MPGQDVTLQGWRTVAGEHAMGWGLSVPSVKAGTILGLAGEIVKQSLCLTLSDHHVIM